MLWRPKSVSPSYTDVSNGDGYNPRITIVMVSKRHMTRLFVADARDADPSGSGNVRAGTVVDRTITHPTEYDFFLQSHAGTLAGIYEYRAQAGARAKAWCLRTHAEASLYLSLTVPRAKVWCLCKHAAASLSLILTDASCSRHFSQIQPCFFM
jgi:hypothetical protein